MSFFVQYDESGNITATIMGDTAPECERQLEFAEYVNTDGKKVDLDTLTLVGVQ